MIAVLTLSLAVIALVLITATLWSGWHRYGAMVLAARQAWLDCPEQREVRFRVIATGRPTPDNVIALPVRGAMRPSAQPLRAAA